MFPGATISASLMTRKFKIGQPLLYHPTNRMKAKGRFIVIRLFPQPDGKVHYRIRSENDVPLNTRPMPANFVQASPRDQAANRLNEMVPTAGVGAEGCGRDRRLFGEEPKASIRLA